MKRNISLRKIFFLVVTSFLVSFFYAAGDELDRVGYIGLTKDFLIKWLLIFFLQYFILWQVWNVLEKTEYRVESRDLKVCKTWHIWERYGFLISVLFLILCWAPEFLSIFPGAFSYDAYDEWQQIAAGNLNAHHPVLHVLLLGGLVELGHSLIGSYNAGIICYSILQMFLLASTFAYTIRFLHKRKLPIMAQLAILLFYGTSPVAQMFSNSATKDTLFAISQLLFMLCLMHFGLEKEQFFSGKASRMGFIFSALGTMILRNNGLYIVLVVLIIFLILSRKNLKPAILMVAVIAACYTLYVGPFYQALNVTLGGVEEMLSVPIQQLARVHKYNLKSRPDYTLV